MADLRASLKQVAFAFVFLCMLAVARADQSCDALFANVRQVATQSPNNYVLVPWTTGVPMPGNRWK